MFTGQTTAAPTPTPENVMQRLDSQGLHQGVQDQQIADALGDVHFLARVLGVTLPSEIRLKENAPGFSGGAALDGTSAGRSGTWR